MTPWHARLAAGQWGWRSQATLPLRTAILTRVRLTGVPLARVLVAACGMLLVGCGGSEEPTPIHVDPWGHARVEGVPALSALAVAGDDLLCLASGDARACFALDRTTLVSGEAPVVRPLTIDTDPRSYLMGAEPFATKGYQLGDLWALPMDAVGLAVRHPDMVFVADRRMRVIYVGDLTRTPDNQLRGLSLLRVFSVFGADRRRGGAADWSDQGPGMGSIFTRPDARRTEDLHLLDRNVVDETTVRLRRIDRFGSPLEAIPLTSDSTPPTKPDVRSVTWSDGRYVALMGRGRGRLVPFVVAKGRTVRLGDGVPGPAVEGVEAWAAVTAAPDGTLYLVSEGEPATVAWRR